MTPEKGCFYAQMVVECAIFSQFFAKKFVTLHPESGHGQKFSR